MEYVRCWSSDKVCTVPFLTNFVPILLIHSFLRIKPPKKERVRVALIMVRWKKDGVRSLSVKWQSMYSSFSYKLCSNFIDPFIPPHKTSSKRTSAGGTDNGEMEEGWSRFDWSVKCQSMCSPFLWFVQVWDNNKQQTNSWWQDPQAVVGFSWLIVSLGWLSVGGRSYFVASKSHGGDMFFLWLFWVAATIVATKSSHGKIEATLLLTTNT